MNAHNRLSYFLSLIFLCTIACTGKSTEILSLSSGSTTTTSSTYIVTASTDGNNRSVAVYDVTGNFQTFTDFRDEEVTPRGLAALPNNRFLMSGDTADSIYSLDLAANKTLFYGSNQFNGTIYDLEYDPTTGFIFAIEGTNIEVFDTSANRITAMRIPNVTGACTLNNPIGMTINSSGNLVVTDFGGVDEILFYDISTTPATCINTVPFPNNPQAILQHSDGFLYVTTSQNDQIFRLNADGTNATLIWPTDTTIINRPIALAELPNGNLLVGAADSDTIEEITTAGARVGSTPFIRDTFSNNLFDIIVVGGQSE